MNLTTRALSSIIISSRICQASRLCREANETCAQRFLVEMRSHCSSTTLIRYVLHSVSYRKIAISVQIVSFSNLVRVKDFTIWKFDIHTFQNDFFPISISYVMSEIKCSDITITYHNVLYIIVRGIQSCIKTSKISWSYARRHVREFLYPVRLSRSAWKIHVRMISWIIQLELFRRVLQSNHDFSDRKYARDLTTDITTTASSKTRWRNRTCLVLCSELWRWNIYE